MAMAAKWTGIPNRRAKIMNDAMGQDRILTREGRFFVFGATILGFIAGAVLGAVSDSFLVGVAGLIGAFILQVAGKELARGAMAKTGTQAAQDYHTASFLGWLTSVILGSLIIWVLARAM